MRVEGHLPAARRSPTVRAPQLGHALDSESIVADICPQGQSHGTGFVVGRAAVDRGNPERLFFLMFKIALVRRNLGDIRPASPRCLPAR